jgi:hypothetical protein
MVHHAHSARAAARRIRTPGRSIRGLERLMRIPTFGGADGRSLFPVRGCYASGHSRDRPRCGRPGAFSSGRIARATSLPPRPGRGPPVSPGRSPCTSRLRGLNHQGVAFAELVRCKPLISGMIGSCCHERGSSAVGAVLSVDRAWRYVAPSEDAHRGPAATAPSRTAPS